MWEQLLTAIAKGDAESAIRLINLMNHVDFKKNYKNLSYNQIPLHYAVYLRRDAIVDELLKVRPELVRTTDKNERTALHVAVDILNNEIIVNKILTVANKILTHNHNISGELQYKAEVTNTVELILSTVAAECAVENISENNLEDYFNLYRDEKLILNNNKINNLMIENTNSLINKLLHLKLDDKDQISISPITIFEHKNLLIVSVTTAIEEVMGNGKIAVMPIYLGVNHWAALVIKKQIDSSLQILYNDPKGNSLMHEKNSSTIIRFISKINSKMTIVDIGFKQENDDEGFVTVDNLIKLATSDTSNLNKKQLQKLLKTDNYDVAICNQQSIEFDIESLHAQAELFSNSKNEVKTVGDSSD